MNEGGVIDDDGAEGDKNPFVVGGFADMFRENFLGLREFSIASELGVSNLSVPEKLLRSKGARTGAGSSSPYAEIILVFYLIIRSSVIHLASCRSKPMEPPSPPFVPLEPTRMIDGVVCLLRPFYKSRFDAPAVSSCYQKPPPHRGWGHSGRGSFGIPSTLGQLLLPSLSFPTLPQPIMPQSNQSQWSPALMLPNDMPNSAQTKMGPLGQIAGGIRRRRSRRNRERRIPCRLQPVATVSLVS